MEDMQTEVFVGGHWWQLTPRQLGKGGFASVMQAEGDDGRLAAVKVCSAAKEDLLVREGEMLQIAQTHPHIVGYIGSGRLGEQRLLFMEHVGGGDLLDRVLSRSALDGAMRLRPPRALPSRSCVHSTHA